MLERTKALMVTEDRELPGVLESVVHWAGVGFWSAVLPSWSFVRGLLTGPADEQHDMVEAWSRRCVQAAGVTPRLIGRDHILLDDPQIFFANHASISDICILGTVLPVEFKWLARKEIFRVPFIGWHIERTGHLKIDRGNRGEAMRLLQEAGRRIRGGKNVIVFPEGTRSPDGRLQPFKKGVFHLAVEAQVPIVPIRLLGSERIAPRGTMRLGAGNVDVVVCPPIPTKGTTVEDIPRLMEAVRMAMLEAEREYGPR